MPLMCQSTINCGAGLIFARAGESQLKAVGAIRFLAPTSDRPSFCDDQLLRRRSRVMARAPTPKPIARVGSGTGCVSKFTTLI